MARKHCTLLREHIIYVSFDEGIDPLVRYNNISKEGKVEKSKKNHPSNSFAGKYDYRFILSKILLNAAAPLNKDSIHGGKESRQFCNILSILSISTSFAQFTK